MGTEEIDKPQLRNECGSHGTKATIKYHDKHSTTFGTITRIVPHLVLLPAIVSHLVPQMLLCTMLLHLGQVSVTATVSHHTTAHKIFTENSKSPIKINIIKEKSPRSLIYPPIPKINPEPNTKAKHILTTPTKLEPFLQAKISHTQPTTEQKLLKISNALSQFRDPSTLRTKGKKNVMRNQILKKTIQTKTM